MKFSDTTNKRGLIQDCETLLGMTDAEISGNTTLLETFTRMINAWYRRVNSWIWESTGTWEYDDSNYTDLPIATTTIVDDQQDYEIPSTAQKIDRVEVKDIAGNYQLITPIDKSQIKTLAMSEFQETAGMPTYYDLVGRSLFLYPKPDTTKVTATAGLKIYFTRDIEEFGLLRTGTAEGTVANHLVDDTLVQFLTTDVDKIAFNTTDSTSAKITARTDAGDVTLNADIFADGEIYQIWTDAAPTKEPGFVSNFHRLLSLGAAYDYCVSYEMGTKANFLKGQINELVEELKNFYGQRHRDMPTRISSKRRNYT